MEKIPFYTVSAQPVVATAVIEVERVSTGVPSDEDAFKATFTVEGLAGNHTEWVSYHTYCMLKPHAEAHKAKKAADMAHLAQLNAEAEALG